MGVRWLPTVVVGLMMFMSACSDAEPAGTEETGGTPATEAAVQPPAEIAERGSIKYCTSFDAPPQEFLDDNGDPAGSDIDLGIAVAELMGVEVEWVSLNFDAIITALQANKCDLINSSLAYTPERDEVVDYVIYGQFSYSIVVETGNPLNLVEVEDLAGKRVAWITGYTTVFFDEIDPLLEEAGLEPIDQVAFPGEPDALNALQAGAVDAVNLANVQADFYAARRPGQFEVSPVEAGVRVFGYGTQQGERELQEAMRAALDETYANGTFCEILEEWNLVSTAGPDYPCD